MNAVEFPVITTVMIFNFHMVEQLPILYKHIARNIYKLELLFNFI